MRTGMLGLAAAITVVATAVAPVCEAARSQRAVQSIIVDGAKVKGNRIAVLHAPAQNVTFVKTFEQATNRYHFDKCIVHYGDLEGDLSKVAAHLNSEEASCLRINDTTFAENDNATKVALKQALNAEITKQMTVIARQMQGTASTISMGFGPLVGVSTYSGINIVTAKQLAKRGVVAEKIPIIASNVAMFLSAIFQVASYPLTDMVVDYRNRQVPTPVEQQPGLKQEEPAVALKLDLPPGLSSLSAVRAFEDAFNDATVEVDDNLHILQGVPMS